MDMNEKLCFLVCIFVFDLLEVKDRPPKVVLSNAHWIFLNGSGIEY